MSEKPLRIYFMGSARIAVGALEKLSQDNRFELLGIGTQLDKPKGRKKRLTATPVGQWAEDNNFSVDKIANLNDEEFVSRLEEMKLDFLVVIAFGQLLKVRALAVPKIACINVHASLLPDYRGASPIATCLLNGDKETGVSIMQMEKGLDSGPVFRIHRLPISEGINAYDLETALGDQAADNLGNDLVDIANGLEGQIQEHDKATFCHKISKEDGILKFDQPAEAIVQKIQAFTPWPGAQIYQETAKGKKRLQIVSAREIEIDKQADAGTIISFEKKKVVVACAAGSFLEILRVIPEGKKEMPAVDCRNGGLLQVGTRL